MKAIILAAGRGERMRPLTDHTPKPLLEVGGNPLIVWHIEALARAGLRDIVINCAWLAEQFPARLGDGRQFGVRLHYSDEQQRYGGALETAGGIASALPLLCNEGEAAFWVVSGDILAPDFAFDAAEADDFVRSKESARLWMVPNPSFHPRGDFGVSPEGQVSADPALPTFTYANLALMKPALVAGVAAGQRAALRPSFDAAIAAGTLGARHHRGRWVNVGSPTELDEARRLLG